MDIPGFGELALDTTQLLKVMNTNDNSNTVVVTLRIDSSQSNLGGRNSTNLNLMELETKIRSICQENKAEMQYFEYLKESADIIHYFGIVIDTKFISTKSNFDYNGLHQMNVIKNVITRIMEYNYNLDDKFNQSIGVCNLSYNSNDNGNTREGNMKCLLTSIENCQIANENGTNQYYYNYIPSIDINGSASGVVEYLKNKKSCIVGKISVNLQFETLTKSQHFGCYGKYKDYHLQFLKIEDMEEKQNQTQEQQDDSTGNVSGIYVVIHSETEENIGSSMLELLIDSMEKEFDSVDIYIGYSDINFDSGDHDEVLKRVSDNLEFAVKHGKENKLYQCYTSDDSSPSNVYQLPFKSIISSDGCYDALLNVDLSTSIESEVEDQDIKLENDYESTTSINCSVEGCNNKIEAKEGMNICEVHRNEIASKINDDAKTKEVNTNSKLVSSKLDMLSLKDNEIEELEKKLNIQNNVRDDYFERVYSYLKCQEYTIEHLIEKTKGNKDSESSYYAYLVTVQLYLQQTLKTLIFTKQFGNTRKIVLFLDDIKEAVGNMMNKLFFIKGKDIVKGNNDEQEQVQVGVGAKAISDFYSKQNENETENKLANIESKLEMLTDTIKSSHYFNRVLFDCLSNHNSNQNMENEILNIKSKLDSQIASKFCHNKFNSNLVNNINDRQSLLPMVAESKSPTVVKQLINIQVESEKKELETNEDINIVEPKPRARSDFRDKETQLQTTPKLKQRLKELFLVHNDKDDSDLEWALCMINIDNLKQLNLDLTHDGANVRMNFVGTTIKKWCDESPSRWQGYKFTNNFGKGGMFTILTLFKKKNSDYVVRNLNQLMKQIEMITCSSVSIGVTSIFGKYNSGNDVTGCDECIERGLQNLKIAKKRGYNQLYWDYTGCHIEYHDQLLSVCKNMDEYFCNRSKDTGSKDVTLDSCYILGLVDIDNFGKFNKTHTKEECGKQIETIKNEFTIFGDLNKDIQFRGYHLHGDEYSLIIKCKCEKNNDNNNGMYNYNDIHNVLSNLVSKINSISLVTISIGYSCLKMDETMTDWRNRCEKYLTDGAKVNGKNQAFTLDFKGSTGNSDVKSDENELPKPATAANELKDETTTTTTIVTTSIAETRTIGINHYESTETFENSVNNSKKLNKDGTASKDSGHKELNSLLTSKQMKIDIQINGPKGTPYENGLLIVNFEFPAKYPQIPPIVTIKPAIWHISVSTSGLVFLNIFTPYKWNRGKYTLNDILNEIVLLLENPMKQVIQCKNDLGKAQTLTTAKNKMKSKEYNESIGILNLAAKRQYSNSRRGYNETAKRWIQKFNQTGSTIDSIGNNWNSGKSDDESKEHSVQRGNKLVLVQSVSSVTEIAGTTDDTSPSLDSNYLTDEMIFNLTKRVEKDLAVWFAFDMSNCKLISYDANNIPYTMDFELIGQKNTCYENGTFYIRLTFPIEYPKIAPKVTFSTKIYHVNVNQEDGNVFVKCLTKDDWMGDASAGMVDILRDVKKLMMKPILNDKEAILNGEALALLEKNQSEYNAMVIHWTTKYAKKNKKNSTITC